MRKIEELLNIFANLRVNKAGNRRAPHKPLLILYVLSRWQTAGKKEYLYKDIETELYNLIKEYGPPHVKNPEPSNPFFYLKNDGIWHLIDPKKPHALDNLNRPNIGLFRKHGVFGTFSDDVWYHVEHTQGFLDKVVKTILMTHFESTLHQDILDSIQLRVSLEEVDSYTSFSSSRKTNRDHDFRLKVLRAYDFSCAICSFSARLDNTPVGIEAAHVQWHTHNGPDYITNGVAMCSLHHKLFDRGVFTIDNNHKIVVSEAANGSGMFTHLVESFHEKEIREPKRFSYAIDDDYRSWHVEEVFRGYG